MRPYETYLLDVDGTLVDSNDAHAHAWVETLSTSGFRVDFERVRRMIGMGGDRLVAEVTGLPRDSKENAALGEERSRCFRQRWLSTVRPLDGARDLVRALRDGGYRYAVASAAKAEELEPLLEIANVADLVRVRTTSSDVDESKPDPEICEVALASAGGRRATAVMVGDTPYDIRAARAAGIAAIAFTSGGWAFEDLIGAVGVLSGPRELAEMIKTQRDR